MYPLGGRVFGASSDDPVPTLLRILRQFECHSRVYELDSLFQFHALRIRRIHGGRLRFRAAATRLLAALLSFPIARENSPAV